MFGRAAGAGPVLAPLRPCASRKQPSAFPPCQFEEIFSKYDYGGKGGLTLGEVNEMVRVRGEGCKP